MDCKLSFGEWWKASLIAIHAINLLAFVGVPGMDQGRGVVLRFEGNTRGRNMARGALGRKSIKAMKTW